MPKIDIVGKASLLISTSQNLSQAATSIVRLGERISQTPRDIKQWGRDNIKLPHAKVQVDYRQYLADNVPAENTPTTEKGEFPAARDCLTMLEQSPKRGDVGFQPEALRNADQLGEMAFQNGYDKTIEIIRSDFGKWLKQYDSRQVKNIAQNAKSAIKLADIQAPDNVTVESRKRIMKQVIKACDERLKELKKSPTLRSNDSSATPAPKASQTASPVLLNSAVTPKPGAPQIEETADQARPDTPTSLMKLAVEETFSAIEFEGVDMYLTSLETMLQRMNGNGDKAAAEVFAETFNDLDKVDQAIIRAEITELHNAAIARGADRKVLKLSEALLHLLLPSTRAVPPPAVSTSAALRQADPLAKTQDQELTAIERLHGTIREWDYAILGMDVDAYRETWETLLSWRMSWDRMRSVKPSPRRARDWTLRF
jgi:hypothetical protein